MTQFSSGQRWSSESEPELGLGTVVSSENFQVKIVFALTGVTRVYSLESAPLQRIVFQPGDELKTAEGEAFTVKGTEFRSGLCFYKTEKDELIPEILLADDLQFSGPFERMKVLQLDGFRRSRLREEALNHRAKYRQSDVCGFTGARIDVIPHQLHIANEVVQRPVPRVMLADEVGLGKTIEACLIIHRLLVTNRISRVLILVPDTLVYQWFVEMYRRFNLQFHIVEPSSYDEYDGTLEKNPFNDHQLVLAGIDFINKTGWRREIIAADWDLLTVDEAHHLSWTPDEAGIDYELVESISKNTDGLLLLTATPEQLGIESHFARLRLLDPERYFDLATFVEESKHYQETAEQLDKILELPESTERSEQLQELLDGHGLGRVIFRNTRKVVTGFPGRSAFLTELPATDDLNEHLLEQFKFDCGFSDLEPDYHFNNDPRVDWLAQFLQEIGEQKVLLICRSQKKAIALEEALKTKLNIKSVLFHESLSLINRDRNAAFFADPEGARILICSEIGSEGRNFQFAEHLVLFDLPLDPELLEQRIGRLDRIGREGEVNIQVPFISKSPQAKLTRWYQYTLNSFEQNHEYGCRLSEYMNQFYQMVVEEETEENIQKFMDDTTTYCRQLAVELEAGRDKVLEMSSFNEEKAEAISTKMREADIAFELEEFMFRVFDKYGVKYDDCLDGTMILSPEDDFTLDIPEFTTSGMTVTFDREIALSREDVHFLSWDHPLVRGVIEMLCSTTQGNSCFRFKRLYDGSREIILECIYVLETIAPPALHIDRFLPPQPIKKSVNHFLEDCSEKCDEEFYDSLRKGNPHRVIGNDTIREKVLPQMLGKSEEFAHEDAEAIRKAAVIEVKAVAKRELNRLKYLQKINPHVKDKEIKQLDASYKQIIKFIDKSVLRLDAVRLIYCGDKLRN